LSQFTRRGELLHWSDRSGSTQGYLLDLKTGQSRQITEAASLDRASLALSPDEKIAYYFDGPNLNESTHNRPIYQATAERRGMTVATDGSLLFAEGNKLIRLLKQRPAAIAEDEGIDLVMARPRQGQIVYRSKAGVFLASLDGTGKRPLKLEPGQIGEILWTWSGRSLIYLHIPDDPKQLITLRENVPDENTDREIARTSQFAAVNSNADASVFTGASRGKASAYVLILLRVTRRELTLCEHRASDANMVSPLFTPDSQSVLFVSDRHGKPALYQVKVEKFVEPTPE